MGVIDTSINEEPLKIVSQDSGEQMMVKLGTVFIEARLKDEVDIEDSQAEKLVQRLESQLSRTNQVFDRGEDLLKRPSTTNVLDHDISDEAHIFLTSLKVVGWTGTKIDSDCYSSDKVKIQIYQLYTGREDQRELEQADTTLMPHIDFHGLWEELVFEEDIKVKLVRMMTNMLRFSRRTLASQPEMNPLILLHGPPGTGKTTLCQGLAQKISIRLNGTYKQTKLIQIKTATLLSKFYSQSAKQVHEIFSKIDHMCREDSERFICVLIDEVESIASSRETAMRGEVQDSLRATNALLTGLDRAKTHSNLIFLCTTNMYDFLDAAFLDRCGLKLEVNRPCPSIQYEILRLKLEKLIANRHISSSVSCLPSYRDADLERFDEELYSSKLLKLVDLINSRNPDYQISGRSLTQLPGRAILGQLDDEECDLDMAFRFMERCVLEESRSRKRKIEMVSREYE